jgi:hypothetical protein
VKIVQQMMCDFNYGYRNENGTVVLTKISIEEYEMFCYRCLNMWELDRGEISYESMREIMFVGGEAISILGNIEKKIRNNDPLSESEEMKETMKFVNDIFLLNKLNEIDRGITILINGTHSCLQFGGRRSIPIGIICFDYIEKNMENSLCAKILYYNALFSDNEGDLAVGVKEFTHTIMKHENLCKMIIKKFEEKEAVRICEPEVEIIKNKLTPEEFTILIYHQDFENGFL